MLSTLISIITTKRRGWHWFCLTILFLYLFAILLQLSNVSLVFSGALPPVLSLQLLLLLPLDLLDNSSLIVGLLYCLNVTLMALFFTLFFYARSIAPANSSANSGLLGSLSSVFGVGCAACGSILTPFIAGLSIFFPLSIFLYVNEFLSLLSTLLISYGIYTLLNRLKNPYQV